MLLLPKLFENVKNLPRVSLNFSLFKINWPEQIRFIRNTTIMFPTWQCSRLAIATLSARSHFNTQPSYRWRYKELSSLICKIFDLITL